MIINTNNLHSESLNSIKSGILGLIDIKYSPLEALKQNMRSFFEIIDEITLGENKATFNRRWGFHEYKNSKYHRNTWQQLKNRNTFVE